MSNLWIVITLSVSIYSYYIVLDVFVQTYVSHDNRRFATRNQEIDMIEHQKYLKSFIVKLLVYLLISKSILFVSGAANARGILENQFELFRWNLFYTRKKLNLNIWDDIIFQQNAKEHVMSKKVVRKLHKNASFPFHLREKHSKAARNLR